MWTYSFQMYQNTAHICQNVGNPCKFHFAYFCMWTLSQEYQKHSHVYLNRILRIPGDPKNSKKYWQNIYASRIFTECKEYQNINVFAFLQHLQTYLGILQVFLSAFPAEFLTFCRVCSCVILFITKINSYFSVPWVIQGIVFDKKKIINK